MAKHKQTKKSKVREMLARPEGATLEAICKATGWQPHSARAMLSGFRKEGCVVERAGSRDGNAGGSVYRIIADPEATE